MNVNPGTEVSQKRAGLMPLEAVASFLTFGGELLNNPGPVGSAVPSSRFLARRIAGFLPRSPKGYVVELGAGTGAITAALLDRGIPADRLISVERSETMVRLLQRRFPSVKVALGDAAKLRMLLKAYLTGDSREVSYVVSSLPLRSLPETVVRSIMTETRQSLTKTGIPAHHYRDPACPPQRRQARAVHVRSSPDAAPVVVWLQTMLYHGGLGQFPPGPLGCIPEEWPFGLELSHVTGRYSA
jgi:phosphatidylethanolamine/phosphatidyl-N-methylethanolamine N-methyltransferase